MCGCSLFVPVSRVRGLAIRLPATPVADPPRTIEITGGDDMKFSVTTIRARAGEPLAHPARLEGHDPEDRDGPQRRRAEGGHRRREVHRRGGARTAATDFIPPSMKNAVIAKTAFAGPGETVQVIFTAPSKPGSIRSCARSPGTTSRA